RNSPWINTKAALPSMLSGAIFAIAMTSFVVAIDILDAANSRDSLTRSVQWHQGRRNLTILTVAYGFTLLGVALMTLSREVTTP
ncbi:hypothetical protein GCK32_022037, partial [Trichostrongylus colubriformis]